MCPAVADMCGILTLRFSDQNDGEYWAREAKGEDTGQMEKDISGVVNIVTEVTLHMVP